MKKFYLFMLALLVSLSSMAWTVKFTNPDNWSTVYAYCFGGAAGEALGKWPGKAMTKSGDVWTITSNSGDPQAVIFHNNSGTQTRNLDFVDGATYDKNGPIGVVVEKECYLVGPAPLSWSAKTDGYVFTKDGDTFKLHIDEAPAGFKCKVLYGANYLTTTDDLVSGSTYTLYDIADGGEMNLGGLTNIDLTFTDPNKLKITFDGEGPTPEEEFFAIHGQIVTPDTEWASVALTKNDDGNWEYTGSFLPGSFGIKVYTTDINSQTRWIGGSATISEADHEYAFVFGSNSTSTLTGTYTFVYNPTAETVTFISNGDEPEYPTIWIVGTMNGWTLAKEGYEMTTTDGKVYTYHFDELAMTDMFKFTTGATWEDVNYGTGNTAMENGVEYTVFRSGDNLGSDVSLTDVTVTFNLNALKAKIEGTPVEGPEPEIDLYVIGEFCDWAFGDEYLMTRNENVYTYVFETGIPEGGFKVSAKGWAPNFGAGDDATYETGVEMDAWYNSANNFDLSTTTKTTVTFTLLDDWNVPATPCVIMFEYTTTGVEAIEAAAEAAAVYYNLQGVRVANPENGLFIRVQGNKASKVLVK